MDKSKKIMVVEEHLIISQDIEMTIEELGYKAINCSTSGEQTLTNIEKEKPDLILIDVFLQGDELGFELAKKIQKFYHIPIIYITTYSNLDVISKIKETNPYGYLIKPIKDSELKIAVEIALYKSEIENKIEEERNNFQILIENLPYSVALLDKKGNPIYINPKFTEQTGYILKDITTKEKWADHAYPNEQYKKYAFSSWEKMKNSTKKNFFEERYKVRCKNGSYKDFLFSVTILKNKIAVTLSEIDDSKIESM